MRTCWFALYERRVAKPLSICNPDRDAFVPRFTDEAAGKRRRRRRAGKGGGGEKSEIKKGEIWRRKRGREERKRSPWYPDSKEQ